LKKGDIKLALERLSDTAREIEEFLIKPLDAIKNDYNFNKVWKMPGLWK